MTNFIVWYLMISCAISIVCILGLMHRGDDFKITLFGFIMLLLAAPIIVIKTTVIDLYVGLLKRK